MKKIRSAIAVILTAATILTFSGCSGFKAIKDEDIFFDALDNSVSIEKSDTRHDKNVVVNGDKAEYLIYANDGDNFYTYIRFKKADDALDMFDDFYQDFEDIKDDGDFEGSHTMAYGKTRGSVIFNGEIQGNSTLNLYNANKYFYEDTEMFGGVYVNDNVYIEVYSINGSKRDKEKITKFLKELGFPKP